MHLEELFIISYVSNNDTFVDLNTIIFQSLNPNIKLKEREQDIKSKLHSLTVQIYKRKKNHFESSDPFLISDSRMAQANVMSYLKPPFGCFICCRNLYNFSLKSIQKICTQSLTKDHHKQN